ncbi:hypothetical protein, partial [Streptomyces misionensis]|uniref:hypothetical protein n=1 Tax=Streptomyces misionensis TaxID=67331 RepID=UPI0036C62382
PASAPISAKTPVTGVEPAGYPTRGPRGPRVAPYPLTDRRGVKHRDPANLNEFKPVDFEDATIVPVYRVLPDGQYRLYTMPANPISGRHPQRRFHWAHVSGISPD